MGEMIFDWGSTDHVPGGQCLPLAPTRSGLWHRRAVPVDEAVKLKDVTPSSSLYQFTYIRGPFHRTQSFAIHEVLRRAV